MDKWLKWEPSFFYYIRALTDAFWKDLMWPLGVMLPLTSSTQSASSLVRTSHHGSVACFFCSDNKNSDCSALLSLSRRRGRSECAWSLSWNDRMWAHDVLLGGTEKALRHLSSPPADIYYLVKDFTPIAATSWSIFACCCEAAPLVKLRLLTVTECVAPFRTGEQSGASRKVQNANVGSASTTSKPSKPI